MARISIINTLSPAGTVISAPSTVSNAINVDAIRDARVFVELEALGGASTVDVEVQIAEVNTPALFVTVKTVGSAFTAAGRKVVTLDPKEVGKFIRLKYIPDAGAATVNAKIEGKQGL